LVLAHFDLRGGHIKRIKREFGIKLAIEVAEVASFDIGLALRGVDHGHATVGQLDVGLVLLKVLADSLPDFIVLDRLNSDDFHYVTEHLMDLTHRRVLDEVVYNLRVYHNYLY